MKETEIENLLKGQQQSLKALQEKAECYTSHDKEELDTILAHLMDNGIIGKRNEIYFTLKDEGLFLANVIVKNRNFVILKEVPSGIEHRISGEESDQLLLNDLVYAKEFQKGVFHCTEYYKPTTALKGYYTLNRDGKEKLAVGYLDACGKQVLISAIDDSIKGEINQGDYVEGSILSFKGNTLTVKVDKLLVKGNEVGSDISMIIAEQGSPLHFPEGVIEEAKSIPAVVSDEDKEGRTDFRDECVVTIDGDDAHDFDDAVSIKRLGLGYEVRIHIADVTAYVKPGHPLDNEAITRGTSIYVADRVVPMLPFELSNGICSLNPNVERLVLTVTMDVDSMGNVFSSKIERGVIRSHGRLTYNQVNDFFEGKEVDLSEEIKDTLLILHEASLAIRKRRHMQGSFTLDSTELKFHLDENGMPTNVTKMVQGESEKMIEDMMVIANCTVARELRKNGIPVLYRVHEFPPSDKLSTFRDFLKKLRLLKAFPKTENLSGARLNDFLESIEDDNVRASVSIMMLRALAKARYTPEELGHFGLAEIDYCHFTSPIRRYPDDIIHRLVKDYIIDKKPVDYDEVYNYLDNMGDILSREEVRADKIQRESDDLESAKYMTQHIGEQFHGKVVGMVQRGMFIETELGIEGFLAYHCMHGDFFRYSEKDFAVYGKETDVSFALGTPIDIKVLASNPDKREIDFATPEFYDQYALDLSEEDRENLSLNGIQVYYDDEYPLMTGKARFYEEHKERENDNMNDENNEMTNNENLDIAMSSMDEKEDYIAKKKAEREDDGFRPSPEQWKEVDVIRAVMAKYPDDEQKVIEVLSVMDISEEEYRKLLRFTKPREDRGSRRGGKFSSRGGRSDRGGHFDRGGKRSFSSRDRGGFSRDRGSRSDRGSSFHKDDRRSSRFDDKKPARRPSSSHSGYAAGGEKSFSSDKERGRKGFHSHDRERFSDDRRDRGFQRRDARPSFDKKPARRNTSRSGYGRNRKDSEE